MTGMEHRSRPIINIVFLERLLSGILLTTKKDSQKDVIYLKCHGHEGVREPHKFVIIPITPVLSG